MTKRDVAYYYPEPFWRQGEGASIKALLLLFDGIGLLVPEPMGNGAGLLDPSLAEPLLDSGHLTLIRPETAITAEIAESVSEMVLELVAARAFEQPSNGPFAALSKSRTGSYVLQEVSDYMTGVLIEHGLARESEDGFGIPMDRRVRLAYLYLLAQHSNSFAGTQDMRLHPVVADAGWGGEEFIDGFMDLLAYPAMPSAGRGVILGHDLEVIDVDLEGVPLDELFDYRAQNQPAYAAYAANIRDFALKLSLIDDPGERALALAAREIELREAAEALRHRLRRAWTKRATIRGVVLGVAGAAWGTALAGGNPAGGLMGGLSALSSFIPEKQTGNVYNYLLRAPR